MPTDLWTFAQTLYARPGVEGACLHLQDAGADVCLLLTALWLEQRKVRCMTERSTALQTLAGRWQQTVITPLRQLRLGWRSAAQQDPALARLRAQVKALELQAERMLLAELELTCQRWPAEQAGDWLGCLAGIAGADNCDALHTLRTAVDAT